MASVFTKIINGEIPSYKVAENEEFYAFLDINPRAKGHTLVIPKKEVDYIFDLENELLSELHLFAKKVARILEREVECIRVGMMVIGTEVPHAHIHLIPFTKESQISVSAPVLNIDAEEMTALAMKLNASFNSRKTVVFGASTKPERYSNKAMKMLKEYNHEMIAIGGRADVAHGIDIITGHPTIEDIHTVTMYMGQDRQVGHEEYILSLKPQRIIFNPGAENRDLMKKAYSMGIETVEACTLVMLRTNQY